MISGARQLRGLESGVTSKLWAENRRWTILRERNARPDLCRAQVSLAIFTTRLYAVEPERILAFYLRGRQALLDIRGHIAVFDKGEGSNKFSKAVSFGNNHEFLHGEYDFSDAKMLDSVGLETTRKHLELSLV